jgi:hypothetical protein
MRPRRIEIKLSDDELAHLDELRGHAPGAACLPQWLYEPPSATKIVTHEDALAPGPRRPVGDRSPP